MTKEEIISKILAATPEQMETVSTVLNGVAAHVGATQVISQKEAARLLGYQSTETIRRMLGKGLLKAAPTPSGLRKVTLQSVHDYLSGKTDARPYAPTKAQESHYASGWRKKSSSRQTLAPGH